MPDQINNPIANSNTPVAQTIVCNNGQVYVNGVKPGTCTDGVNTWSSYVAPVEVIQEDDPRWDCHTMGNHICGNEATVAVKPSDVYRTHPATGNALLGPEMGLAFAFVIVGLICRPFRKVAR